MSPALQSNALTVLFVGLIGFGLYRRVKRTFGLQPISPTRMIFRLVLLSLVSALFLATARTTWSIVAILCGAAMGAALSFYGLARTTYEVTPKGKFYRADRWVSLGVMALFIGRLAARSVTLLRLGAEHSSGLSQGAASAPGLPPGPGEHPFAQFQRSPLTVGIFFLMAVYYIFFYIGILRKAKHLTPPKPQ
jgi:hypothetical protein